MAKYKTDVRTSEKAYQYIRYIHSTQDEVYASAAAEKFGVKQPRATKILKDLEKTGCLRSKKKGRKKIYEIDYNGLFNLFWEFTGEKLTQDDKKLITEEIGDIEPTISKSDARKRKDFQFLEKYATTYLEITEESNIRKMLLEDFYKGVDRFNWDGNDAPEWMVIFDRISELKEGSNDPRLIFETAVDKFKEGIADDIPETLAEKSNYKVEILQYHGDKSISDSLEEIRSSLETDEEKNIEEAKKKINELKKSTVRVD